MRAEMHGNLLVCDVGEPTEPMTLLSSAAGSQSRREVPDAFRPYRHRGYLRAAHRSVRAPLNSTADDCGACADAPNAAAARTVSAAPEPMPVNAPA
jgi:hypothetical protein